MMQPDLFQTARPAITRCGQCVMRNAAPKDEVGFCTLADEDRLAEEPACAFGFATDQLRAALYG